MTVMQVTMISLVVTLAVITAGFFMVKTGFAHERGFGGGHHFSGWHHAKHRCGTDHKPPIDKITAHVNDELDLNDAQIQAWQNVTAVMRTAHDKKQALCKQWQALEDDTPPEKLAFAEQALTEGLSLMQQFRPAFDGFYGTLSEEQKAKAEELIKQKHRGGYKH